MRNDQTQQAPLAERSEAAFGRRVRVLRVEAGLTQAQLAQRLKTAGLQLHQTAIAKIETANRSTSVAEICALAVVFDCDPADLVRGLSEPPAVRQLAEAKSEAAALTAECDEMLLRIADLERRRDEANTKVNRLLREAAEHEGRHTDWGLHGSFEERRDRTETLRRGSAD